MNCQHCGVPIPEATLPGESGRFACPSCGAEHIRRQVGQLPSGEPLYSVRLWGHLTTSRRKSDARPNL